MVDQAELTKVGVVGAGMTGSAVLNQLCRQRSGPIHVSLYDPDVDRARLLLEGIASREPRSDGNGVRTSLGSESLEDVDVAILASPAGHHVSEAERLLRCGINVVSLSDSCEDVDGLLALSDMAGDRGLSLAVGAGFAPGLTCLLARFAGDGLDAVEEIATSKVGTGGPECARQHHRALKSDGLDWVDQDWLVRSGGSGRDLSWFPGEIGAHDCYRGALPSPRLLQRQYASATRITARVSATRRDRLTSRLPMLRPPHRDGGPGAVRVEVRGWLNGGYETRIYGATAHPSVAAGTVAAVVGLAITRGSVPTGSFGLAEIDNCSSLLLDLRDRGLGVSMFGGSASL